MLEEYKDVLTVDEMREILHIGKNTAYKIINAGEIPAKLLGGKFIIPKQGIIRYLKKIQNAH